MQPDHENLSAQQSLDIITAMIRQAKGNVSSNSFYFLLWGWTIAVANMGVFVMFRFTEVKDPTIMFSITIVSAVISLVYGARQSRRSKSTTILDAANMWIWIGYGVICFTIAAFGRQINWQVNPILITVAAVPTFVTGIMLRFKPLMFGGAALWLSGIILFLVPIDIQFLVAAIAITIGYLVPGYLLRKSNG